MNKKRAIHPGEILRKEFMTPLGLSAHALVVALRLARYFNSTPQFWLNLQTCYDLKTAQLACGPKIEREDLPHAA